MDRFWMFFPAALTFFLIAAVSTVYMRVKARRLGGDPDSIALMLEREQTYSKLFVVLALFYGPALEELVFRLPLLIAFPDFSWPAWPWILACGFLFGLAHIRLGRKMFAGKDFMDEARAGKLETDSLKVELKKFLARNKGRYRKQLVGKVLFTSGLGIGLGYLAVRTQSLWVSGIAHCLWNLIGPLLIIALTILLTLLVSKLPTKRNRRRKERQRRIAEIMQISEANLKHATEVLNDLPADAEQRQKAFAEIRQRREAYLPLQEELRTLLATDD